MAIMKLVASGRNHHSNHCSGAMAERPAILELIESERANGHLYEGAYCLQNVAAAIRA
jgi:hypothetical protein